MRGKEERRRKKFRRRFFMGANIAESIGAGLPTHCNVNVDESP